MSKKFINPFASQGQTSAVPEDIQPSGDVSWQEGFGADYAKDYGDPTSKDIDRQQLNKILLDTTEAIAEIQTHGVDTWSALVTYPIGALVWHNNVAYQALASSTGSGYEPPHLRWAKVVNYVTAGTIITARLATKAQAEAGTDNTNLMTPLRSKEQIDFRLATKVQAEAGADNTKLMTPLRSKEQIDARRADKTTAEAGADNAKLLTPLRSKEQTDARLAVAGDVGATTTNNTKLMTPLRTKQHVDNRIASTAQANNPANATQLISPKELHRVVSEVPHGIATITTGSGNWTVPAGVYSVKYTITAPGGGGAGRGGSATDGGNGGNTSFNSTIVTTGGRGGAMSSSTGAAGGTASGGDINIVGGGAEAPDGGSVGKSGAASYWGGGGPAPSTSANGFSGVAYGSGGSGAHGSSGAGGPGGAGATAIGILTVTPGDLIPYAIGTRGANGSGTNIGGMGAPGIIVLEY